MLPAAFKNCSFLVLNTGFRRSLGCWEPLKIVSEKLKAFCVDILPMVSRGSS